MSDGLSDIARDQVRFGCFSTYANSLVNYMKDPSKSNYNLLKQNADETDYVIGGYFGGGNTNLSQTLDESLDALKKGDKRTWARTLGSMIEFPSSFKELKELSPFSDSALIYIDYGHNFVRFPINDFEKIIHQKISNQNFRTFDSDDYLVVLPRQNLEESVDKAEIVWVKGARVGPRDKDGNPKKA